MNTRINILQWILTKLGTYLDLKRIWNPIDFQGQRSQGLIFRQGDTPRFALPLFSCRFFLQQLKYYTQIHVRSTRGKNAKGSKITGIEPLPGEDKVKKNIIV